MTLPSEAPSKRSRRKAFNGMVRVEAKRRLHAMRKLNDAELELNGLSDALTDLAVDVDEYPAATSIVRTMMGLDDVGNPVTVNIDRAARIDELNRWVERIGDRDTISEYLSNELRERIAELEASR